METDVDGLAPESPAPSSDEWRDAIRVLANVDRLREVFGSALYQRKLEVQAQNICTMVARLLRCPYAAVDLITGDSQVAIAARGFAAAKAPLSQSICQYVVAMGEPYVIVDASKNKRLTGVDLVANGTLVCYLGAPLVRKDQVIGALCVFDSSDRRWTLDEVSLLTAFAQLLMELDLETELGEG